MKPKGVILYLSRSTAGDLTNLKRSLKLLDRHFNRRFGYPVLVFHEDFTEELMARIRSWTRAPVEFPQVSFQLPAHIDAAQVPPRFLGCFGIGYRHMCRFFAGPIYRHPALQQYDWYWRLDTDSFVLQRIDYDVFAAMEDGGFDYGYLALQKEFPEVVAGLWDAALDYARSHGLPRERLAPLCDAAGSWNLDYYYNNFEICRLSFGRSAAYQDFFEHLYRTGGIYYRRWGDAPIRTLAVMLLVPPERRRHFADLGYAHAGYYSNRPVELRERLRLRAQALLSPKKIATTEIK